MPSTTFAGGGQKKLTAIPTNSVPGSDFSNRGKTHGAVGNAVATRGRHFGWCLLGGVGALALMGL